MGCLREPPDLLHAHRVSSPSVYPLLGQEALLVINIFGDVGLVLNPRAAGIVGLLVAMEDGGDPFLRFPLFTFNGPLLLCFPGDLLFSRLHFDFQLLSHDIAIDEAPPLGGFSMPLTGSIVIRHVRAFQTLPFAGLVPNTTTFLEVGFRADHHFFSLWNVLARVRSVPEVMEGEILLIEGKLAHSCLLDSAHLVIVEVLLEATPSLLEWPLQRLAQCCYGWIRQDPLVDGIVGPLRDCAQGEGVDVRRCIHRRQQCKINTSDGLTRDCLRSRSGWQHASGLGLRFGLLPLAVAVLREEVHAYHLSRWKARGPGP
mmetsp:Transcript_7736/g.10807  ORF Transcript_7736/g.10807 Transcript_7736/m.10807 type:complete len:314 (+) Transcript_7736:911-1852(+)